METVNMHEAKTHLSRLVEKVLAGESFTIARAGRPVAKLVPIEETTASRVSRFGFCADENWIVPEDRQEFKDIGKEDIELMFGVGEDI
jgi:prevent-host-death family protein